MDITTIRAYLVGNHSVDMSTNASVEIKRDRALEDDEAKEPVSKKKPPSGKGAAPSGESPINRTHQKEEFKPSPFHPGSAPLLKEKWEERLAKEKKKGKEGTPKRKEKTPAYKLQSNIESSINLKAILKKRIMDTKIEFMLREVLSI